LSAFDAEHLLRLRVGEFEPTPTIRDHHGIRRGIEKLPELFLILFQCLHPQVAAMKHQKAT